MFSTIIHNVKESFNNTVGLPITNFLSSGSFDTFRMEFKGDVVSSFEKDHVGKSFFTFNKDNEVFSKDYLKTEKEVKAVCLSIYNTFSIKIRELVEDEKLARLLDSVVYYAMKKGYDKPSTLILSSEASIVDSLVSELMARAAKYKPEEISPEQLKEVFDKSSEGPSFFDLTRGKAQKAKPQPQPSQAKPKVDEVDNQEEIKTQYTVVLNQLLGKVFAETKESLYQFDTDKATTFCEETSQSAWLKFTKDKYVEKFGKTKDAEGLLNAILSYFKKKVEIFINENNIVNEEKVAADPRVDEKGIIHLSSADPEVKVSNVTIKTEEGTKIIDPETGDVITEIKPSDLEMAEKEGSMFSRSLMLLLNKSLEHLKSSTDLISTEQYHERIRQYARQELLAEMQTKYDNGTQEGFEKAAQDFMGKVNQVIQASEKLRTVTAEQIKTFNGLAGKMNIEEGRSIAKPHLENLVKFYGIVDNDTDGAYICHDSGIKAANAMKTLRNKNASKAAFEHLKSSYDEDALAEMSVDFPSGRLAKLIHITELTVEAFNHS